MKVTWVPMAHGSHYGQLPNSTIVQAATSPELEIDTTYVFGRSVGSLGK